MDKELRVIFGFLIITILVLISASIYLVLKQSEIFSNKIFYKSIRTSKDAKQDIIVDFTSNIIEYNVLSKDVNTTRVDDYNKLISVTKLIVRNQILCYATPLNDATDLTKIKDFTDIQSFSNIIPETEQKSEFVFKVNKIPIPDISFLNRNARKLCEGVSVKWAYPVPQGNYASLEKRGICDKICVFMCKYTEKECGDYCWIADAGCVVIQLLYAHG